MSLPLSSNRGKFSDVGKINNENMKIERGI